MRERISSLMVRVRDWSKGRLADQDQVVGAREVLAEQAQFAQAIGGHEMGVVNDGHEHFAGAMDAEGLLDQQAFAVVVVALELDLEGFAEDAQGVVIGVKRAVDHRGDHAFGVVVQERLFQDAFAGAGFAQHQAEAALLGVDAEDVEDFLLVGQQRDGFGVEGIALQAKMGADHRKFQILDWGVSELSVGGSVDCRTGLADLGWPVCGRWRRRRAIGLRPCVRPCNKRRRVPGPGALEADVDGAVRQMARRFKAERFEGKGVVGADVAFFLDEEQFVVGLIGRQEAHPFAVQREAVQRGHAEDGMDLGVVVFLDPLGELAVEGVQ